MSQPVGSAVVTGEAVALDLRTAALPSRVVARLVDAAAQGLLLMVVAVLATVAGAATSTAAGAALGIVTLVLVLLVYPIGFETVLRGRTPGKAAMGLRVVRDDGGPIGFRQALVRGMAVLVDLPTVFVVSVLCMLLNARNKRVGDLLAGTVVLQERVAARGGPVADMPPQLAPWATTLELSRLPDDLALSVRSFLARSADLTDAAREDLGGRLVRAVLDVTAPPPPPGTPGWAFLSAVLAERRRREELRLAPRAPVQPAVQPGVQPAAAPAPPAPLRSAPATSAAHPVSPSQPDAGPTGFSLPS